MAELDFLATLPIFNFFTRPELEKAETFFNDISYAKDDVVVRIGEPGDTFYVVLEGELEVWDASTPPRQTGSLKRGDYFGEMALLQGGKRTATVTVARRAHLLSLDKDGFDELFLKNPKAIEYFARVLSQRLAGVTRGARLQRATTTVSVASNKGLKGESLLAFSLAEILKQITQTEVIYVEVQPSHETQDPASLHLVSDSIDGAQRKFVPPPAGGNAPVVLKVVLPADRDVQTYGNLVSNLVARLSDSFSFIVLDLGSETAGLIDSCGAFSDYFVAIVDKPGDDTGIRDPRSMKVLRAINLFNPTSRHVPINSSEPFVIPHSSVFAKPVPETSAFIAAHPRAAAALPIHRMAHKILGTSIGLALGGGAAFGLAHLGVLQTLENAGIEVDLVAGCSQGSIVAVGYAAGLPVSEMINIARELGVKKNFFYASDPTFFFKPGIIAGQRFLSMMRPYLKGKETFEQLVLPCRTVATDIETGERVDIGTGRLEAAFRASSSVPMVMAPVRIGEHVLVDGGVADPVPAKITADMGADLTVAVNVVPPMKRGVENAMSAFYRKMSAFNPLNYLGGESQDMPSLFDIVMNSMQILQYELGNFKAITADVLINPDLSDFTWIEYYRAEELIARGAEAAERALPAIRKALEARIAPIRAAAPQATRRDSVPA
ncbi:MAG TPA: patatin-like phospholipase family protein [Vicinamibacterales bacterium]|jgi:NTE family protein|nr:patatin-like phospholipase family protein [Vicinamibacterales bacterium]